jgi:hypothetical protein
VFELRDFGRSIAEDTVFLEHFASWSNGGTDVLKEASAFIFSGQDLGGLICWKVQRDALLVIMLNSLNWVKFDAVVGYYSPRKYPYFDVVVGLVWSHDPKSYAGSSVCYC